MTTEPMPAPPARAPEMPAEERDQLVALLAPYLRAADPSTADDGMSDLDMLIDARPLELLDALHAAGVLVYDDMSDRAHLRKSWAAMSTALIRLSQDRELTPDVLVAVPASHRMYLMGHEAAHRQLTLIWSQLLGARLVLEQILSRGTAPSPVEIAEVVEILGGDNPYAGGRPPIADPWWGCWTDAAAVAGPFDWGRYERTCDPDAQLDGLGDLCAFLGGTWSESIASASITGGILHLIVKAQNSPERFAALERAFPREVTAWRVWRPMSPSPTARELHDELVAVAPGAPDPQASTARPDAGQPPADRRLPSPAIASYLDQATRDRTADQELDAVSERATIYAGAIVVHTDGSSEILRAVLDEYAAQKGLDLSGVPADARPYALPWPAGTRAVYDPIEGVGLRETGRDRTGMADSEVLWRDLFVEARNGMHRCLLGRVRRLETHEKRRSHRRHWWQCRYCELGATDAASMIAEAAEQAGHEAICPDQDRMNVPGASLGGDPR